MVRHYKIKTNRRSWSDENLEKGIESILQGETVKNAAAKYEIPRETLRRHLLKMKESDDVKELSTVKFTKKHMGFKTIFTKENEELLCDIILKHEAKLHGFTSIEVRRLAYNLAKELKLQHYFKGEQCLAGKEWFRGFLRRHPQLSLRKPEPTSAARAIGFNKTSVTEFFNILDKLYKEYNFQAENIYNVDETGISCNPKSQSKVIARRGKRQVGCKVSRERGETVTACLCFSACGRYMPPLLIFPRKRVNTSYLEGASPGAWAEFDQSGWMDESIFIKWLKKFIIFSHASKDMPILLVLDGHSTHVKNLEAIKLAEQNGVIIVYFPPHCTHKLQPLDLAFMKPLSNHYSGAINQWLREHPYSIVNLKDTFSIFTTAFIKASTMETAINGFRKTGVFPFNPNVFSENDFIATRPLETIESNIHATEIDSSINIVQSIKCDENSEISEAPIRLQLENNLGAQKSVNNETADDNNVNNDSIVCLNTKLNEVDVKKIKKDIMENVERAVDEVLMKNFSNCVNKKNKPQATRKKRAKGKAAVITSSEYQNELIMNKAKIRKISNPAVKGEKRNTLTDITNEVVHNENVDFEKNLIIVNVPYESPTPQEVFLPLVSQPNMPVFQQNLQFHEISRNRYII